MMNKIQNSPSFGAIQLSKNSKPFARNIAQQLENAGFTDRGVGDIFIKQKTVADKAKTANMLREGDIFCTDEFAMVFFQANNECFIVGNTIPLEHKMLTTVLKHDPDAKFNLGI